MPAQAEQPVKEAVAKEEEILPRPVRKRKGGPRSRLGCLTCRNRKKKCDGGFPVCAQCHRLNFSCLREPPRSPVPKNAHAWKTPPRLLSSGSEGTVTTDPSPLVRSLSIEEVNHDEQIKEQLAVHRKEVMRHYVQTFGVMITTNLENNCFLSVFLPMAIGSSTSTLLDAVLAWSSSHMSLQDEKYKEIALQYRGVALNTLSSALSRHVADQPELETSLASCLILCSMEIIIGDTAQWYSHLQGAYEVIRSASATIHEKSPFLPTGFLDTWDGRFLLQNFAFHDVLMTVTCNRKPFLRGFYWRGEDDSVPDPYFGLASRLLYLISETSFLNADMAALPHFKHIHHTRDDSGVSKAKIVPEGAFVDDEFFAHDPSVYTASTFSSRASDIEMQLLQWQCASSSDTSLVASAECYRSGALIHLYRCLRQHLPDLTQLLEFKVSQAVQTFMECLDTMPPGCLPECTLLFPLFMAGGEARQQNDIAIIRNRLVGILNSRYFKNFASAIEVLDEVWAARSAGKSLDWSDVLREKGWKLALT